MTKAEAYEFALARIKKGWCKQDLAQSIDGTPVDPDGPEAVRWCILGALPSSGTPESSILQNTLVVEIRSKTGKGIGGWNDDPSTRRSDVIRLLNELAAKAKEQV